MIDGLILDHPIDQIRGAEYNPRKIDVDALDRLKVSLTELGCCKPIIVRGQTIVAGHQRTKALRALGVTTAPVYLLKQDANLHDEIRFNQLHNGTDMDRGDENATVKVPEGHSGFLVVNGGDVQGNLHASGAGIRNEIMRLTTRYGPWGCCVATPAGQIIHAAQYALACKGTKLPLLVYVLRPDQKEAAQKHLNASYGEFCYDNLQRNTFIQTYAQLHRMRDTETGDQKHSPTYEGHIIPWLEKNRRARVLDFGCGQGDYVKHLQALGYRIIGMELFRRVKGADAIDIKAVNLMVDALCRELKKYGRFDAVVMDYVLNSIDSMQAQDDVLRTIAGFCKPGGKLFYSGRLIENVEDRLKSQSAVTETRGIEFLDKNGFSGLYRKGQWFYQKFHSEAEVLAINQTYGWTLDRRTSTSIGFNITATNAPQVQIPVESLGREFNMKMGLSGHTLNRHNDVIEALKVADTFLQPGEKKTE